MQQLTPPNNPGVAATTPPSTNTTATSNSSTTTRPAIRASLACVQCRSRHLKCDAGTPVCSRCRNDGSQCTYLKSRRGGRARANPTTLQAIPGVTSTPLNAGQSAISVVALDGLENVPTLVSDQSRSTSSAASHGSSSLGGDDLAIHSPSSTITPAPEPLLDLYYTYFHNSQPCALPLHFLKQRMNDDVPGMKALILVMQFIGSLYAPTIPSGPLEEKVKIALSETQNYLTGFEVQALLLYSIAAYWCDNLDWAQELFDLATDKALTLGMNYQEFARENSQGDPVVAESWRRTWWLLYAVDAHIAGSIHATTFRTSQRDMLATVELPCEEEDYNLGNIPPPKTLEEYDNREFAMDEGAGFSSFAYLVGLVRSLDIILFGIPRTCEENMKMMCTNADASVVAWLSLLSKSKRKLVRDDGTVDELLFKANMLIQIYTVDIHRYLSTLKYSPIESVSSCSPPPPPERLSPIYYRDAHIHTAKILCVMERMTDMLTLPTRIAAHSPFNICIIAATSIAHLSACKHVLRGERLKVARERIRVSMGALEVFAEVWPRAKKVVQQVKTIARELLSLSHPSDLSDLGNTPLFESRQSLSMSMAHTMANNVRMAHPEPLSGIESSIYYDFPCSESNLGLDLGIPDNDISLRMGYPFDVTTTRY